MTIQEDIAAHTRKIDASGNVVSAESTYIVKSDSNTDEESVLSSALSWIKSNASTVGSMNIAYVEIAERISAKVWKVTATYEDNSLSLSITKSTNTATMSFDCGGGTKHMTVAYDSECKYGGGSCDLIGWNGKTGNDCEIKGVDVPCASLRETYTKTYRMSALNTSWRRRVASMVGCVNSSAFKGWKKGEVMFLGCSFSGQTTEKVTVTYNFAIRLEETIDLTDVPQFTKKGWDYLWVVPQTAVHSGTPVTTPKEVYVATVALEDDFNSLGI